MNQILKYKVVYCSGETEKHPAAELNQLSDDCRGWQSPKFAEYPIELVIQLESPSLISQLQFLSHQYKIASKIDLFSGNIDARNFRPQNANWKALGYLRFDDNLRTNYKAREQKTVQIKFGGQFIRFLIHKNHLNSQNLYAQVGIISLKIIGSTRIEHDSIHEGGYNAYPPSSASSDSGNMDSILSSKIRELNRAKIEAAEVEDFQMANLIKKAIDHLAEVAGEVSSLERSKKVAVSKEDYETASSMKYQIDQLKIDALKRIPDYPGKDDSDLEHLISLSKREMSGSRRNRQHTPVQPVEKSMRNSSSLNGESLNADKYEREKTLSRSNSEQPDRYSNARPESSSSTKLRKQEQVLLRTSDDRTDSKATKAPLHLEDERPIKGMGSKNSFADERPIPSQQNKNNWSDMDPVPPQKKESSKKEQVKNSTRQSQPIAVSGSDDRPIKSKAKGYGNFEDMPGAFPPGFDPNSIEEKPIATKKQTKKPKQEEEDFEEEVEEETPVQHAYNPADDRMPKRGATSYSNETEETLNGGTSNSANVPSKPEPLPTGKMKEAEPLIQVFGENTVLCLYSKTWQLREQGVRQIQKQLDESSFSSDESTAFNTCCQVLGKTIPDKITHVYYGSIDLLKNLVSEFGRNIKKPQVQSGISNVVQMVIEKTGDSNPKTRDVSSNALIFLSHQNNVGATFVAQNALKKVKNTSAWRPILGKVELLSKLMEEFGFGENGIPKEAALDYFVSCFDNSNPEVRDAAVNATVLCFRKDPKLTQKKIENVKPQIKNVLESKFQDAGGSAVISRSQTPVSSKSNAKNSNTNKPSTPTTTTNKSNPNPPKKASKPSPTVKKSVETPKKANKKEEIEEIEEEEDEFPPDMCQFCGLVNPSFIDEKIMDLHFMQDCKLLTECVCEQVIEINALNEHLLTECDSSSEFYECKTCKDAIPVERKQSHAKECIPAKDPKKFIRCPLCKQDILQDETRWKNHLVKECEMNPRSEDQF